MGTVVHVHLPFPEAETTGSEALLDGGLFVEGVGVAMTALRPAMAERKANPFMMVPIADVWNGADVISRCGEPQAKCIDRWMSC